MSSRFRNELTTVPTVRIWVGKRGLTTTIGWNGSSAGSAASSMASGSILRQIGDPRFSGPLPTDRFLIPGTRRDFGGGSVSGMTSPGLGSFKDLLLATRQREQEIKGEIGRARWQIRFARARQVFGWLSLAAVAIPPVRRRASQALALRQSEMETLEKNLAATRISVNFDMDSEVAEPHRRMQAAFERMRGAHRSWCVSMEQRIDRVRARTLAGTVIERAPALLHRKSASLVDTQDPPLAMAVLRGRSTAYFYPGFLLIEDHGRSDFALTDITELGVEASTAHFTETEAVPPDAMMVGTTWAKANKNGSRDRRFAHNRELPILRYGCLSLSNAGGMDESFMFSNAEPSGEFASAVGDVKRLLTLGRPRSHLEGKHLLGKPG